MSKMKSLSEKTKEEWAGMFVSRNKESKQARKELLEAGFYVNRIFIPSKIIPEARIRGILYRGIKQIRQAIRLYKKGELPE